MIDTSEVAQITMVSSKTHNIWITWFLIVIIILIALALRLPGYGESGLWNDEAIVAAMAEQPFPELLEKVRRDAHPPLFFVIEKFIRMGLGFEGWTEAGVRAISLVFGILTIPVIFLIGRQMISNRAGLLAAFLLAISPMHVHYSREGRNYMLLMLLVMLAMSCVVSMYRRPNMRTGFLSALVFIALVYTHNISIFILVPVGLMLVVFLLRRGDKESLSSLGVTLGVSLIGVLPWLPTLLSQSSRISKTATNGSGPIEWVQPHWEKLFPFQVPTSLAAMSHGSMPPVNNFVYEIWWTAWLALGVSAVLILAGWRCRTRWQEPWSGYLLVTAGLGSLILLFIASWIGTPIYTIGRVDTIALPAFILLVASGIQATEVAPGHQPCLKLITLLLPKSELVRCPGRLLGRAAICMVLVVILTVVSIKPIQTEMNATRGTKNKNWIRYFSNFTAKGDIFIVTGKWWTSFEYYLPRFEKDLHLVGFPSGREEHPNWLDWSVYKGDKLAKDADAVARKVAQIAMEENSMVWVYPGRVFAGIGIMEFGILLKALLRHMTPVTLDEHPRIGNKQYLAFRTKNPNQKGNQKVDQVPGNVDSELHLLPTWFETARELQNAGQLSKAIPYFERIVELNAEYQSAEFWLGFAYQKSGQSQNAIDTYIHFLEHNPDDVQTHFNLAYEYMDGNSCKNAVVHFNKVLELRPSYLEVHLHLSSCYRTLGDETLARKHGNIYQKKQ